MKQLSISGYKRFIINPINVESMMGLRPRHGNLRLFFQIKDSSARLTEYKVNTLKMSLTFRRNQ